MPFPYLVPDEALLPVESLRFFTIDPLWIECLRDGAFSIGRVLSSDVAFETHVLVDHVGPASQPARSGILLRSEVVSGWPEMQVNGYTKPIASGLPLAPIDQWHPGESTADPGLVHPTRRELRGKNVALYLFPGQLTGVDIHLRPELLHFGFRQKPKTKGNAVTTLTKPVRDADGQETSATVDPVWRDANRHDRRVVELSQLKADLKAGNNGRFALMMTEGVPLVRFVR